MFGVRKYDHFVKHFRELMIDVMQFEPCLVIIPYPDGDLAKIGRPFANDCSMLSSSYWCQIYIDILYITEERPTTVKIFVGHDMPSTVFNSKKCAQIAYERDGAVCVCTVQASKVMEAGYLQESTKTINNEHWTDQFNVRPRLKGRTSK